MFRAHRIIALAVLLAAAVVPATFARQQGPPGDREVRTTRDGYTNETITTLTLLLRGPKGPLPINLDFATVSPDRPKPGAPRDVRMNFHLNPMFVGELDSRHPHLALNLDEDTKDRTVLEFNLDDGQMVAPVLHISVGIDAAAFARIGRALAVRGRLFGMDFAWTTLQVRALREFCSAPVAAHPQKYPRRARTVSVAPRFTLTRSVWYPPRSTFRGV